MVKEETRSKPGSEVTVLLAQRTYSFAHPFFKNRIQVISNLLDQTRHLRQVLLPVVFFCQNNRYQFLGTDNTVTMLAPELLITFQPVCIVLYPDIIKIDGVFVKDIVTNTLDAMIVRSITDLAKAKSLSVVAEFVETQQQQALLHKLGVQYLQGYLIGRPQPLAD